MDIEAIVGDGGRAGFEPSGGCLSESLRCGFEPSRWLHCEFCGGSSCKLPSGSFQWKHGFAHDPRDRGDHEPGCRRHACCNGGARQHGVRRSCFLLPLRKEIARWSDDMHPAGARVCVGWKCVALGRTTEAGISRSSEGGRQSIRSPMHAFVGDCCITVSEFIKSTATIGFGRFPVAVDFGTGLRPLETQLAKQRTETQPQKRRP